MPPEKIIDWQCPAFEVSPAQRQGWVEEQVQAGDQWWRAQPSSGMAEKNLALLSGDAMPLKLRTNSMKSDIRKFVETISDIREIATYGTGAAQFEQFIPLFNKTVDYIYRQTHFPRQSRQALQYAVGLGRGYLWPRYTRKDFGWGEGGMEFKALGPREVLPTQLPSDNDIQGAYAVTIFDCLGVAEAHARFPRNQADLHPISRSRLATQSQVQRYDFWDRWKYGQTNKDWDNLYCEIRWTFVRDLRINMTGTELEMGDPGTSWCYKVPAMGQQIVSLNPENGLPQSRIAREEDCRLYPQLRLLLTNPGMAKPLYDGPAFDWHGMMPAIAYDVDDWPWLAVGYSLLQDVAGIERAERTYVDLMYRVLKAKMKPPMGYDLNAGIPREDLKHLDLLQEAELGSTIGVDGNPNTALTSVLPDSVTVTPENFTFLQVLEQFRQKALGLNDLASLAQLKFNISAENFDKMLETIGPIAQGIAANMEVAHAKIAQMLKFSIPQYYSTQKLLAIAGPDAVSATTFDAYPNSIVPSHMPEESQLQQTGKESNYSQLERAKRFACALDVIAVPSFLLKVTQMQEQMKWLNFLQRGFPVSFSTAFKKLGVDNWGETPGKNEFEKWQWEQREMAQAKVGIMQTVAGELPPQPGAGAPPAKPNGQGHGGGRPPSGKEPPHLEMRGTTTGEPRTILSQSK